MGNHRGTQRRCGRGGRFDDAENQSHQKACGQGSKQDGGCGLENRGQAQRDGYVISSPAFERMPGQSVNKPSNPKASEGKIV